METPGQILYEILGRNAKLTGEPEWAPWRDVAPPLRNYHEQCAFDYDRSRPPQLSLADMKALEAYKDTLRGYAASARGEAGF